MEFVIITGMSGSGKSRAIAAMEDIGYYCVDNLPPRMVKSFTDLCLQAADKVDKVAIVIDARSREIFGDIFEGIEEFLEAPGGFQLMFLDCDDAVLVQRYKETRRKHPLMNDKNTSIEAAVAEERRLLSKVRDNANYVIDTTYLSVRQLRDKIIATFLGDKKRSMLVNCMSFGFKYGIPPESDLVFDVRFLPNPYYEMSLRERNGTDPEVRDYVFQGGTADVLMRHLTTLIDFLLPRYMAEGKANLIISVGCTGGKHRSVAIAEALSEHLRGREYGVVTMHRDYQR